MSTLSMTGFGRATSEQNGIRAEAEIATVNRRQFDCNLSLPAGLSALEEGCRSLVHEALTRGRAQLTVRLTLPPAEQGSRIDPAAVKAALAALRDLAAESGLPFELSLSELARMPGCLPEAPAPDPERVRPVIEDAVSGALRSLNDMRRREGETLRRDLEKRLQRMGDERAAIARRAPLVAPAHLEALRKRVAELGETLPPDDPALRREMVLYADRMDISEELTRLESHFNHAVALFDAAEPCGRKLDFLCQEMNREANTIGSKANDAEIARHVVELKTLIETFREQVQNLE